MAHDTDPFNRWEAGQKLMKDIILKLYNAGKDHVDVSFFINRSSICMKLWIELKYIDCYLINCYNYRFDYI